ncbi:MAG: hypothetical protein HUK00_00375 [Bacteroidaceae bacterium]|nr:hypothetical protein [Bacteroidaceae bacterium]
MTARLRIFIQIVVILISLSAQARSNGMEKAEAVAEDLTTTSDTTANARTRTFYMEMTGTVNPVTGQLVVTLSVGKSLSARVGIAPQQLKKAISDKRFQSMAEAMNYLANYGWRLADTYTINARNMTTIHWVVAKDVRKASELMEGLVSTEEAEE